MRVLVIADTHVPDFARALPDVILREATRADLILHAGDVTEGRIVDELARHAPVRVAFGNNDRTSVRRRGARNVLQLSLEGVPVVVVHDAGPRDGRARRMARRFPEARLVVFGHSHIPVLERAGTQTLLNPGSPTWKRREPLPTYAVVSLSRGRMWASIRTLAGSTRGRDGTDVRSAPVRRGSRA